MKAIETKYRGYRFRSRLEARWAVFFDALFLPWEYEKEGYNLDDAGLYLPDFWLPTLYDRSGQQGVWVEIKGQHPNTREEDCAVALSLHTKHPVLLFVGVPTVYHSYPEQTEGFWFSGDGGDDNMVFHRCDACRLVKVEFHNDYYTCFRCKQETCTWTSPTIKNAVDLARAARFEEGQRYARRIS